MYTARTNLPTFALLSNRNSKSRIAIPPNIMQRPQRLWRGRTFATCTAFQSLILITNTILHLPLRLAVCRSPDHFISNMGPPRMERSWNKVRTKAVKEELRSFCRGRALFETRAEKQSDRLKVSIIDFSPWVTMLCIKI